MADNSKKGASWDLDKLYWPAEVLTPQLAIGQGNKWVLAVTDWVADIVAGVIDNDWDSVIELVEDFDWARIKKLESFEFELSAAFESYKKYMWEEYWNIEAMIMNIEYQPNPFIDDKIGVDDIEALTVFSMIYEYDREKQLILLNWLLAKLKLCNYKPKVIAPNKEAQVIALKTEAQAILLCMIEITRMDTIAKSKFFPRDTPADLVLKENLQKQYENTLEKIFFVFNWSDLELVMEELKYVIDNYIKTWKTDVSMRQFQEDLLRIERTHWDPSKIII